MYNKKRLLQLIMVLMLGMAVSFGCAKKETPQDTTKQLKDKYDTKESISAALTSFEENKVKKIVSFKEIKSISRVLGFTMEGIPEKEILEKILMLLEKYQVKTTFFVQGIKSAEDPALIEMIVEKGHEIGSYTLNATKEMQKLDPQTAITDMVKTKTILEQVTGKSIEMIRCNATSYTNTFKKEIAASGMKQIIIPSNFLSYQSLKKQNDATGYIKKIKNGTILSIKLDSILDSKEYAKKREIKKPAGDKKAETKSGEPVGTKDERLVKVVEMVLKGAHKSDITLTSVSALKGYHDTDLTKTFRAERKKNAGKKAVIVQTVNTSKPYVGISFRSIGKPAVLKNVLAFLKQKQIKATFFITGEDVLNTPELVKLIIGGGHEIGNGGWNKSTMIGKSYAKICREINKTKKLIKEKFHIKTTWFTTVDAKTNNTILEAASTLGYRIAGYNKSPIRNTKQSINVASRYFRNGLNTGDIVSLRLDNYDQLDQVINIINNKAANSYYSVVSLTKLYSMMELKKSLHSIPGWNKIHLNANWKNYKYNKNRVVEQINTKKKVVFFTFDDWGSDSTIRNLLQVMKQYKIKGTFFARGNGVENNPNLLKAISDAGHTIGNHTYEHKVVTKLSKGQLQYQIVKCHRVITEAIGKRPTLYFRPPTMDLDENTTKAILSTGVRYIVRGETLSTHDYEYSPNKVADIVMKNLVPGGIITMHMSDTSCAAKAIPIIMKRLKAKGYTVGDLRNYLK